MVVITARAGFGSELDLAFPGEQHVVRRDIAVNQPAAHVATAQVPGLVDVPKAREQLAHDVDGDGMRQGARLDELPEVNPFDVLRLVRLSPRQIGARCHRGREKTVLARQLLMLLAKEYQEPATQPRKFSPLAASA
jgi:hypothetical protein